jgi:hypothetical protein
VDGEEWRRSSGLRGMLVSSVLRGRSDYLRNTSDYYRTTLLFFITTLVSCVLQHRFVCSPNREPVFLHDAHIHWLRW